jgi:hypothetical protein
MIAAYVLFCLGPNPDILGSRSRRQSRYRGALAAAGPVSDAYASYQLAGSETANIVIRCETLCVTCFSGMSGRMQGSLKRDVPRLPFGSNEQD